MPASISWEFAGEKVITCYHCDERLLGDADGTVVYYPCGMKLKPDEIDAGKCAEHKREDDDE